MCPCVVSAQGHAWPGGGLSRIRAGWRDANWQALHVPCVYDCMCCCGVFCSSCPSGSSVLLVAYLKVWAVACAIEVGLLLCGMVPAASHVLCRVSLCVA